MYTIHKYLKNAKCEYSNREGEAVELSSANGSIDHAILCFPELQKLLRFRQSQIEKKKDISIKEKSVGSKNV